MSSKTPKNSSPRSQRAPLVFAKLDPVKPTVVYDTYWKFAAERQKVFFSRILDKPKPWSNDSIINQYKFTNAYRASDRVSQYLIKNVIYSSIQDIRNTFFRIILFKLFNRIETWELLETKLGELSWDSYRYNDYDKILTAAMASGKPIYSAAYIMASGHKIFNVEKKHQSHLKLIEKMMKDSLPDKLRESNSMRHGFSLLTSYPLIGDFLAYQLITDINYSEITGYSEMEFTMPGPGARDGIRKCFASLGGLSESEVIRIMADRQEHEFERLNLEFLDLGGRKLQLIDVQNLFCEVDKYSRIKHPEVQGISGRTRIKQKFNEKGTPISFFYPPKWGISLNWSYESRGQQCLL